VEEVVLRAVNQIATGIAGALPIPDSGVMLLQKLVGIELVS
jgi:hypothetical protein